MYEKFFALAFVLAATVEGQCDPYYGECDEAANASAPVPMFPADMDLYVWMNVPEVAPLIKWVAFGVFDDLNNSELDDWIANFDWENA